MARPDTGHIGLGGAILAESTLSFLGLGVPPDMPTWGGMLAGAGRRWMLQAWWLAVFPGVFLSADRLRLQHAR